jgi:hypothetical protein
MRKGICCNSQHDCFAPQSNKATVTDSYAETTSAPFKTWKPKLVYLTLKKLVRTAKETQHLTTKNVNGQMLFRKIMAVYYENHTKPIGSK